MPLGADAVRSAVGVQTCRAGVALAGTSSLQRLLLAVVVAAAVGGALLAFTPWEFAVPAGWSAGHGVFLLMVWPAVWPMAPDQVEQWAAREDDTRTTAGALLIGAAVASIVAYLSFTIGTTYQVSDTGLRTKRFRRTLLRHALLSYLFGAAIIATLINTLAGFVSR